MDACSDIRKKLLHLQVGLLSPEEAKEVQAHVTSCEACRKALGGLEADLAYLRRWPDEEPPRDTVKAILDQAGAVRPRAAAGAAPAAPPSPVPAPAPAASGAPAGKGGVDLDEILGGDSLEKELKELENLVHLSKKGASTELDLSGADIYAATRKPAGSLSTDEREKLLKELGLDEGSPKSPSDTGEHAAPTLDKLAEAADQAAKRKSRRTRKIDEEEWKKMCGTTVLRSEEILKACQEAEKKTGERKGNGTDEWLSQTATGEIPSLAPGKPAPPPAEAPAAADGLLGTTILPATGGSPSLTRRLSSRLLAQVKSEDPNKRERKRKMWMWGTRTVPVGIAAGIHVLAAVAIGIYTAGHYLRLARGEVEVRMDKEILDPKKEIEEEKQQDSEKPDPMKEKQPDAQDAEETDEPVPDKQQVNQGALIGIPDPDAPPELRQKGNVDIIRRSGGGKGGGGGEWEAVVLGLEWLRRHQDEDGKWDWLGYTSHCRQGICNCPHGVEAGVVQQGRNYTVGLTGLALLCYLGSGYTHTELPEEKRKQCSPRFLEKQAAYRPTVGRALDWLKKQQQRDGCLGPPSDAQFEGYMYNHGICTLALLEAFQMTEDPSLKAAAQKAVEFIQRAQGPRGGWDYVSYGRPEGKANTRSDVSVSSWQVMALKSAFDAGLPVDGRVWNKAKEYFQGMTRRRDGSLRYASAQNQEDATEEHLRRNSVGVSAAGLLSKLYLGWGLEAKDVRDGAALILQDLPDAQKLLLPAPPGAEFNFHSEYYWYYGTLLMFHLGGEYWTRWKERIVPTVKSSQNVSGAKGSWDPKDEFLGRYAGRLYATTFNILNLEIFYRYLPLYKSREAAGKTGPKEKTLDELLEKIRVDRDRGALGTVEELGMRFGKDERALEGLAGVLADPKYGRARYTAYNALMRNRREALPFLRRAFLQVDDTFKRMIMVAFREEKDREAARVLEIVAAGADYSKSLRSEAAGLLKELAKN